MSYLLGYHFLHSGILKQKGTPIYLSLWSNDYSTVLVIERFDLELSQAKEDIELQSLITSWASALTMYFL